MANKEKSFYYEKSPHQKRWGAYRERQQERRMRNEKRELQAEHRERIHSGRKRAGIALANAFAVILAFIILSHVFGFVNLFNHGNFILKQAKLYNSLTDSFEDAKAYNFTSGQFEDVYVYNFTFSSDTAFSDTIEESFFKLSAYKGVIEWFFGNMTLGPKTVLSDDDKVTLYWMNLPVEEGGFYYYLTDYHGGFLPIPRARFPVYYRLPEYISDFSYAKNWFMVHNGLTFYNSNNDVVGNVLFLNDKECSFFEAKDILSSYGVDISSFFTAP